jgi:hypothetical protein
MIILPDSTFWNVVDFRHERLCAAYPGLVRRTVAAGNTTVSAFGSSPYSTLSPGGLGI